MTAKSRKTRGKPAGRKQPGEGRGRRGRAARAPAGGRKGSRREAGTRWPRRLKWASFAAVWMLLIGFGTLVWYAHDLPDIGAIEAATRRPGVTLLDTDGGTLAAFGDLYGAPLRLDEMPPFLVQAVIATEDRRFMEHAGIDPWSLLRAALVNLREGEIRQGGSTITQQLAKNLFLTPERSIRRKVQEALLALWLEHRFTKEEILAIYLNRVYLGAGTYGVGAAAQRFFGKAARELTLYEAAMLAGLLKAPSRYNPLASPEQADRRANLVLQNMIDAGFIDAADAAVARVKERRAPALAGGSGRRYFADWVLEQIPAFVGYTARDLTVVTTLDPRLQRLAEQRVASALGSSGRAAKADQAALVALAPEGAVRAMVGGRDYRRSQFNRATQAQRQPGSAFKPFVYLAALEAGLKAGDRFRDAPVRIGDWSPRNYDDRYYGDVTLREALTRSLNSVAVRVSERVGRDKVVAVAHRLGITSKLAARPSIALGTSEVSLLELTAAYAAFANDGDGVWPYGIVEIRDDGGRILYRRAGSGPGRVVERRYVAAMNDLLRAVIAWGTGKAARLDRPAAGKTGTSQDFRDAWFVGYTADLVAGVWVGNDDGEPMAEITGGTIPARLWRSFMADALAGRPALPLPGVAEPRAALR